MDYKTLQDPLSVSFCQLCSWFTANSMSRRWAQRHGSRSPWGHTGTNTMHETFTLMRCTVKVSAGSFSEVLGACTTNGCTTPTPTIQLLITLCWDSLTFVKSWWMFLRRSYHTSTWGKCTQMSMRLFTLCSLVVLNLGPLDRTYIYCMVLCLGQPWSHRLWGLTLSCAAGLGRSTMQSRAEGKSPAALVVCWDNRESLCSRSIPSALQWIYFIPWPSVPRLRNGPDFVQ